MTHPYQIGGPLPPDSPVYIERQVDQQILHQLRQMNYLLIIEPRQQGKTSLVQRVAKNHSGLQNVTFAYVYLNPQESESAWYRMVCSPILRQARFIKPDQKPAIPQNGLEWRDFLSDLANLATQAEQRLVIILDEIGAAADVPGMTEFFSVLRDTFNSRQFEPELQNLTFWLVGTFQPRDLIKDSRISPFNIAQQLRLPDFTVQQVQQLVEQGNWTGQQAKELAQQIHAWTNGVPYITQWLCAYLADSSDDSKSSDELLEQAVERFRREDDKHLPHIFDSLQANEKLRQYLERIYKGEQIKFYPSQNHRQAELELLGLIKADEAGYCTIRNKIYEQALAELFGDDESSDDFKSSDEYKRKPDRSNDTPQCRRAIIIGINQYNDPAYQKLNVSVNDAKAMQLQLIADGYEPDCITMLTDETEL
jgi:hypothetical protein